MLLNLASLPEGGEPYDLVVIGAVGAGLTAALFGALGDMMVDRSDINHRLGMTGPFKSFKHVLKIVARHPSARAHTAA